MRGREGDGSPLAGPWDRELSSGLPAFLGPFRAQALVF